MRDSFSVIGFTEAELGFIVAILLFAVSQNSFTRRVQAGRHQTYNHHSSTTVLTSLPSSAIAKEVNGLEAQIHELKHEVADLQKRLNRRKLLQSAQKPSCIERGIAHTFIAEIGVVGADEFRLNGQTYPLGGLLAQLSQPLQLARQAGCVQSIRVEPVDGLSTNDYIRGRNRLAQFFYPRDSIPD